MPKPEIRTRIRFRLNDRDIEHDHLSPTATLLDYLRLEQRLTGAKEGCAEGDCGACTVLVGRLVDTGEGERLVYEAVNSCIRFLASVDGCHVVTIEHLTKGNGALHPVQQALVDLHGSQCGFCTPGIVMSLYGLWMEHPDAGVEEIERALQGNLCRCTGYRPIVEAALQALSEGGQETDPLMVERSGVMARLKAMRDGARVEMKGTDGVLVLPANVDDLAGYLVEHPEARLVAGATDVGLWVTKFMRSLPELVFIGHLAELQQVLEGEDAVTLGSGVTYARFRDVICRQFPQMADFWPRIGGVQVRNMGTIGGNIANGSPIGDTPPALIALGAAITLRKGEERRFLRLEDYFIAYGQQDREPGEFIESVSIPYPGLDEHFAVYKVSKRRDEDISTLCGGFRVRLDTGNRVVEAAFAYGGMAGIPKRASNAEEALSGKEWSLENVMAAMERLGEDFTPLSDVRGSAAYRLLAARNLLKRFYLESLDDDVVFVEEPA